MYSFLCTLSQRDLHQYQMHMLVSVMLWSQIIYGHRMASFSPKIVRFNGARPAAGRIARFFLSFSLDIVRCPVKFRYYFKSTAPLRSLVGSLKVKWHRPGTVRCLPAFAHIGRAPEDFFLNLNTPGSLERVWFSSPSIAESV